MLSEKITILFDALHVTSTDVARSIGCAPSNFSRLKHGTRVPRATSPTMSKLLKGIFAVTDSEEKRTMLCHLCGATATCSDEILRDRLLIWLYDGIELPEKTPRKRDTLYEREKATLAFGKRLNSLMRIADLTNGGLSKKIGVDTSYVSRLRRGERMPVYHSKYITSICFAIIDEAGRRNRLSALSHLSHIPEPILTSTEGPKVLQEWLFLYGSKKDQLAVDHLLSVLISPAHYHAPSSEKKVPNVEEIRQALERDLTKKGIIAAPNAELDKKVTSGVGEAGIRSLVTHFLLGALEQGETELLLYSDQPMQWMGGDFAPVLQSLMLSCIQAGMHVHIVHNIDRTITELFQAIEFWMPLIVSGKVTSYFSDKTAGVRFSHTMFVSPNRACIEGFCARGMEHECFYRLHETRDVVDVFSKTMRGMTTESKKLIEIDTDWELAEGDIAVENVLVNITPDRVVVKRTEDPKLSFSFTHPLMCHAFYSYFQRA